MNRIVTIDGASPQYWIALREGHRLVRLLEARFREAWNAPLYIRGALVPGEYDHEYEPVENMEPWDRLGEAQAAVARCPAACRILEARGRYEELMRYYH